MIVYDAIISVTAQDNQIAQHADKKDLDDLLYMMHDYEYGISDVAI